MIICNKCQQEKQETEYYKNKRSKTGYFVRCKECCKVSHQKLKLETYEEKCARKLREFKERNEKQQEKLKQKQNEKVKKTRVESKERYKNTPIEKIILWRTRTRANKEKIPFTLELEDIIIPDICPILKIPIYKSKDKKNSPSVDRIIPEYGYIKSNVQIISNRANKLKNNASPEELLLLADWTLRFFKRK